MNLVLSVPDGIAESLGADGLERGAPGALVLARYQAQAV